MKTTTKDLIDDYVTGLKKERDWIDQELARFSGMNGTAALLATNGKKTNKKLVQYCVDIIRKKGALTSSEVIDAVKKHTDYSAKSVGSTLRWLVRHGSIEKIGRGTYTASY
jgi:hypothetical protein